MTTFAPLSRTKSSRSMPWPWIWPKVSKRTMSTSLMTGIDAPVSTTSIRSAARNEATPAMTTA